ncbi:hypothetical protein A2239_03235 [Candidatus Uhrbacteria bacterium RIFOXYA2_FULL_40_9]|nr:MAG: hypothetical protein A2239_03235 [Candidatus Uhrbacteria bacterium RIFOXYA2_FULL_40_9]
MSEYYQAKRQRNLYNPKSHTPFRLSRSKIDLFFGCPQCFYLDRRLGVGRPPGFPFNLNVAVDTLLKKEFDFHRAAQTQHPLMGVYGIDAVPFQHPKMDEWRDSLRRGVTYLHKPTQFLVTGGVDDVWINGEGELIVVDYKATSKQGEVNLNADWQIGYKRQMEVYQWLLRHNDFAVSDLGYFVYCNGNTDKEAFDGKLEFDVKILPYEGNDEWVEETLVAIHACLQSDRIPDSAKECDYCAYRQAINEATGQSFLNI